MDHTRTCANLANRDEACTCGLRWRIELQTEREMHQAWRKRAEESEAKSILISEALRGAQRIIERDFPNGQLAIDICKALAAPARGEAREPRTAAGSLD